MAYTRRRKKPYYRSRIGGRRRGQSGDSLAGVTIVQILVTLCAISGLYFTTFSDGKIASYIKGQAKEAMSSQWSVQEVMAVMGSIGEITPITDIAGQYLFGQNNDSFEQETGPAGDPGTLGQAIFAGSPQTSEPIEEQALPDNTADLPETIEDEPDATDTDIDTVLDDNRSEITASTEEGLLGSGGMLMMAEGSFTPPDDVVTSPVYLSVKLNTPTAGKVTSPFGFRTHPITGKWDFHTGVDIAADKGTDILSALQGTVAEVGTSAIYGKFIIIDHGGNVITSYSHCDKIIAQEGQRVAMGARIATVGSTGISTGPHLHFELIVNGQRADPLPHLRTAVVS